MPFNGISRAVSGLCKAIHDYITVLWLLGDPTGVTGSINFLIINVSVASSGCHYGM
ncbi:unnamed protein product [Rhodiola kirilowii]